MIGRYFLTNSISYCVFAFMYITNNFIRKYWCVVRCVSVMACLNNGYVDYFNYININRNISKPKIYSRINLTNTLLSIRPVSFSNTRSLTVAHAPAEVHACWSAPILSTFSTIYNACSALSLWELLDFIPWTLYMWTIWWDFIDFILIWLNILSNFYQGNCHGFR